MVSKWHFSRTVSSNHAITITVTCSQEGLGLFVGQSPATGLEVLQEQPTGRAHACYSPCHTIQGQWVIMILTSALPPQWSRCCPGQWWRKPSWCQQQTWRPGRPWRRKPCGWRSQQLHVERGERKHVSMSFDQNLKVKICPALLLLSVHQSKVSSCYLTAIKYIFRIKVIKSTEILYKSVLTKNIKLTKTITH